MSLSPSNGSAWIIVEGFGEYEGLNNLVRKAYPLPHVPLPILNAGGAGRIVARLEELLVDIVRAHHPRNVIVTIDEADVVGRYFTSCATARRTLDAQARCWLDQHVGNFGLHPLPDAIVTVMQSPFFETWLCGDPAGLVAGGLATSSLRPEAIEDVDRAVTNHRAFLEGALKNGYRKRPAEVAKITKALDPARIVESSRSFRKFMKEVDQAYC